MGAEPRERTALRHKSSADWSARASVDHVRPTVSPPSGQTRPVRRFLLAQLRAEALPGTTVGRRCRLPPVSNAAHHADEVPQGLALLPGDLTEEQLLAAPVMVSIDALLIEDLGEDEDEAFAAALSS